MKRCKKAAIKVRLAMRKAARKRAAKKAAARQRAAEKAIQKKRNTKKNTWYRKFRAAVLHLEHRQMLDKPVLAVTSSEAHTCKHCGTYYTGAYCPKCSMPARWERFNWKLLFLNFMDIWGLGNRPMFRTIRDLFWRPGYMIRDYLNGHHLSYFPPFKMLAVWTVLLMFVIWVMNKAVGLAPFDNTSSLQRVLNYLERHMAAPWQSPVVLQARQIIAFVDNHLLYSIIIQNIFVVLVMKWTFRKVSNMNLVETFISQIYINCQFHILAIATMLIAWKTPETFSVYPYMRGFIPPLIVLIYDLHQLYGLKWKQTIKKVFLATLYLTALYLILILGITIIALFLEYLANPAAQFMVNGKSFDFKIF